jgi:hypothetical protein
MHGELRVTVIATGFDKPVVQADAPPARTAAAPGVLPFEKRPARPTPPPPPGFAKPEPPRRQQPGSPPPEVNEMEIPTFIRRQMD